MAIISGIACDKCGQKIMWEKAQSKSIIVAIARDYGWSVGKATLCPTHNPRKKRRTPNV